MKKILLLIVLIHISLFAEKLILQLDIVCDEVGNAKIIWKQQATALQWKLLMQRYGNNPSLLKKEIVSSLPSYELSNFKFTKDEMNRTFIFSFDAKGIVKYRGNGIWQFKYEKEFTPRKINEHTWLFSNTETMGNTINEQYITLKLPPDVKNVQLTKNEFDEPVLQYYLKPSFWHSLSITTEVGIVLIVLGIGFIIFYFFGSKQNVVA